MDELLLGIDIGTTHTKALLATPEGQVIAQAEASYPVQRARPGWAEQNPEDWWQAVTATTRTIVQGAHIKPEQVCGIGVSGQGCAATLIDQRGAIVRPAIIWMDSRSEAQCDEIRRCCAAELVRRNGKFPAPYNADPALMWLARYEPDSITQARCSLTATGYVNFRLTGEPVMNISDASILFAFDLDTQDWSEDLIGAFELPRRLYPRVAPCTEVIGGLQPGAAEALRLRPGTPVIAGGEDTSAAGLAIGVTRPGQALLSLGTAGTVYIVQDRPLVDGRLLTFLHVLPGQALLGGSTVAVGAAIDWCKQLLAERLDFAQLALLAQESPPGADGLLFLPYLSGELQPINDGNARGVFFGLSLNTGRSHVARAVLEGAAFALAHNLQIASSLGAQIGELRAVGSPTRSPALCQIIADITERELAVLDDNPGAPLGDALLAAAGVGLINDPAAVAERAQVAKRYEPHRESLSTYRHLFEVYQGLYPHLKESFSALVKGESAPQ